MRKQLFAILAIILMGALFAMPAHAVPIVNLNLLDNNILVGESFDVQVWADGGGIGEELLAFGFDVSTTGSAFSYDGFTIGSGFDDDSFGPNNVAGSTFTGIAADDVLLATLSFTGLSVGSGNLFVSGPFDGKFSGLFYEFSGFTISDSLGINVNPAGVPEPATIFLLGGGLLGLAGASRKKFLKK